ncbi:RNA recognition motif-containing protein [Thelotrema lepadinum]|nr:RNA recognition motif-containing protein [Thelotrema lepadinum]
MASVHRDKRRRLSEEGDAVATALADLKGDFHKPEDSPDLDLSSTTARTKLSRSLFVRSIPLKTTNEALAEHFSQSYPLKHATVVFDRETKKSKGYGFVTFADTEDAQRAREEFDGSTIEGKKIRVDIAEPRHREVEAHVASGLKKTPSNAAIFQSKSDRTKQDRDVQTPPKLVIRNLPWSIKTSDQLATLFRSYGKVKHATVPKKKSGLSPGFGFIVLRGRKNAEKAISEVNGKTVDGRVLAVDWAVEKTVWEQLQADPVSRPSSSPDLEDELSQTPQSEGSQEDSDVNSFRDQHAEMEVDSASTAASLTDEAEQPDEIHSETKEDLSHTLFIRNLPFNATDNTLFDTFSHFGPVRYARVVTDPETERSRGTGFVCFRNSADALTCLKNAPRPDQPTDSKVGKVSAKRSVLENTQVDPLGRFSIDGRVLQISRAVDRREAQRLDTEGRIAREGRDRDRRRLYLLTEGTISPDSSFYATLTASEIKMREESGKQRQALIKGNPTLHISLTRLSVRSIPRHLTSKDLKALAREAVVGFARDVKEGRRQRLSKEELQRGSELMKDAEQSRKAKGQGIVKQAHVVFEAKDGSKVGEKTGAGRSRGYGFIEYTSHRSALMGLRWLNGFRAGRSTQRSTDASASAKTTRDETKRLIVEFAIENAQVVARRQAREDKTRQLPNSQPETLKGRQVGNKETRSKDLAKGQNTSTKRGREVETDKPMIAEVVSGPESRRTEGKAKHRGIIAKKRAIRKARRSTKP